MKDATRRAAGSRQIASVLVMFLLLSATGFAQKAGTEGGASRYPDELQKDNSAVVAASAEQIEGVLRTDPGLLLELKQWISNEVAKRGQVLLEEDLSDAEVLRRLGWDRDLRLAATRMLQRYGHLLPTPKPGSEAALQKEKAAAEALQPDKGNAPAIASGAAVVPQAGVVAMPRTVSNPATLPADAVTNPLELSPAAPVMPPLPAPSSKGGGLLSAAASEPSAAAMLVSNAELSGGSAAAALAGPAAGISAAPLTGLSPDSAALQPAAIVPTAVPLPPRDNSVKPGSFQAEAVIESSLPGSYKHTNPYEQIPSVYDIYAHIHPGGSATARFGEDIFANPADASRTIPIDFPTSPDYVLGPGDGLTINLWGGVTQRLSSVVDHEGRINLPETGPVLVSGKSLSETQSLVQHTLQSQFRDVSTDISLSRLRTVRVYVVGDVNGPGAYDVSSLATPLNVLLAAGGPTSLGSLRVVQHYRGTKMVQEVDLYDLLLHGSRAGLERLEAGDSLLVPPIGSQIRIDGLVRRPAIYELHGETNLAEAINLAGGLLPTASLNRIEIQRLDAHEKRTMVSLDLSDARAPQEVENRLKAFTIRDRDEVHIFPIATFNQDAVYLQGHVLRQGRYSYKAGMKVTDLISSYADLLPDPSTKYAEIIHLASPNFSPSMESFDLGAALANPESAPKLQPLDTIRIYSRYDFEDVPIVSVSGEVRNPGTYPTPGPLHFRDAIHLAGGLTPDAAVDSAQVIRPMPDSSLQVLNIRLTDALNGDPMENVLLQPRDRILIQKNALAEDPKSVVINGQVTNPGRYPLTPDLRVTDLIKLAGGFKRGAETSAADLTQFITSATGPIAAKHVNINLTAANSGDRAADVGLADGDVLTVRQRAGWEDVGASITVEGEVAHPGTYGLRAGERLSSVIERAGGFQPEAFPFGAILKRSSVRNHELDARDELISRVRNAENNLIQLGDSDPKQKVAKELAFQQWQANLDELTANPPVGRISIRISGDMKRWKNTTDDIQLQSGDVLVIPKKPGFIMVTGEVFNPTAITIRPGKNAKWYLTQAGGMTPMANHGAIFVIRADGSVLGGNSGMFLGKPLSKTLQAGDTVVVPEKALSGNIPWQNILLAAQVASSMTSAAFIALRY
jgi:protein involved in polysaccharide export with SLBB domain